MKRIVWIFSIILLLALVLSACQPSGTGSVPTSTNNGTGTTVKPSITRHDDNDNNGICDNCTGTFVNSMCMGAKCAENGEHVLSEYKSNEYVHWREYICGHPWPEMVEEHVNMDADLFCDVCGYGLNK